MTVDWEKASTVLKQAKRVLVVSHVNPDGDAIGSTLAIGFIASALGIKVTLVNESPIPEKFLFLPGIEMIKSPADVNEHFSTVIAVDAADASRMGSCQQLFDDQVTIINIDHHGTNNRYGTINIVEPNAAATVELLYDWVCQLEMIITKELAMVLYTGLLTDTGSFRYPNTSPHVLRIAAHLLEIGIPAHIIADRLLETITLPQIRLLGEVLPTMQVLADGKLAYLTLEQIEEDTEGLVNYARNIEGVDVGILFRSVGEQEVKVNFRSRELVDVGEIALEFGGGGHKRAAGCTMIGSMEEIQSEVLSRVTQVLKEVSQ
jgi:phosphoesterase RecJ-like protein